MERFLEVINNQLKQIDRAQSGNFENSKLQTIVQDTINGKSFDLTLNQSLLTQKSFLIPFALNKCLSLLSLNFFKQICSLFIFTQKHQVFSINLFLVASKVNEWVQPSLGPVLKECPITP